MTYLELKLYANFEDSEDLTVKLEELVPGGFSVEDPRDFDDLLNKEHDYDWDYVDVSLDPKNRDDEQKNRVVFTVYLEDTADGLAQMDKILSEAEYIGVTESTIRSASDDEWKDKWKAYFKPAKVSKSIVVKPTWEEYEAKAGEKVIEIDPGMAFGTGTHETTSLCIKALEKYISADKTGDPLSILDVGCGSGILSFAARLLAPDAEILGVDIDPVAVAVSKENAVVNRMESIDFRTGDLTKGIDFKADIIVANLMADLVILLSKDVKRHLFPEGLYITSGILAEKLPMVRQAVEEAGFTVLETPIDGEWSCIVAKA